MNESIVNYLVENSFTVDEMGRIVIDNPDVLAQINGAQGANEALGSNLLNGACSNGSCR